ncbi:MAG: rhomboid family intramembrane serine protease, partial [Halobacteria archaeon]|nr:rhomboid family intramembrane serine protease [Halobacteria archaeon]
KGYSTPWWAGIAIESHGLGLLVGVVAAVLLARRRDVELDGVLVGAALVVVGVLENIYAIWTLSDGYVLYRGIGVGVVALGGVVLGYGVGTETS